MGSLGEPNMLGGTLLLLCIATAHQAVHYSLVSGRGVKLFGTSWAPTSSPLGLVYISHGYGEHMGYYHQLGKALAEAGLFVFGHDHEGHGKSDGERVNIPDFQIYVDDVFQDIQNQKQVYSGLPVFLFGHSMGGTIALLAVMEKRHFFQGLVLTGPLVRSDNTHGVLSPVNRVLAKVMTVISPSFQAGGVIEPSEVTSNQVVIKQIKKDNLFWKGQYKARHTHASFRALDKVNSQFGKVVTPFLVLHGLEDTITQPEGSKALVAGARSRDKQLVTLARKKHHLIQETDGYKVIRRIVGWITARI